MAGHVPAIFFLPFPRFYGERGSAFAARSRRHSPIKFSNSQASSLVFFAALGAPSSLSVPLEQTEGMERREAHPFNSRLAACASLAKDARPAALHRGDFCPRGRNFRTRTGGLRLTRTGQLSPPFVRAASSHQGRSLIGGGTATQGLLGRGITSPVRRRRT